MILQDCTILKKAIGPSAQLMNALGEQTVFDSSCKETGLVPLQLQMSFNTLKNGISFK